MDYKSGWNDWDKIEGDKRNDTLVLLDECFSLLKQKMKDDAHIYVFGNPNEMSSIQPLFEKHFKLKNILVWDRQVIGMGDLKTYGRSYDVIYFGYNNEWKDLNGTRDRDVLNFTRVSPGNLIHPTEKPTDMLQYLIKKSSNENDVVFDPFAGSCSTLKASLELNRNSYGSELETKYIPKWML
jgi:site-specific DNA-methyltransferase (adenine-specific)